MNDAEKVSAPEYIEALAEAEYIEALAEELRIRVEVENEIVVAIPGGIADAVTVLGDDAAVRAIRPHIEAEVGRRVRDAELERKRAGLR